jgi:trk system potassium uptake protein TrkH
MRIALLVFLGRVGSVSFAVALLEKRSAPPVEYPAEEITVG